MALTVTCPGCKSVHKVKETARGRKFRCPTDGCGQVLSVPVSGATKAPPQPATASREVSPPVDDTADTFRLALPDTDTIPAPAASRSKAPRAEEPPVTTPRGAYLEVLLPEGTIVPMEPRDIRRAVRKGTLTRFSLMHLVEDDDIQFSEYGFVKTRPPKEHPWQAIGKGVDFDDGDEPAYVSRAAREAMMQRESVGLIVGGIGMALLVLYLGVVLYAAEWDVKQWSTETAEAIGDSSPTSPNRDWRFKAIVLFTGTFPEMGAFIGKSLLFLIGLIPAALLAVVIAFVSALAFDVGYRIWHYDPEDKPEKKDQQPLPPDGYPWKFWKSWEQKRLLRQALSARE